MTNRTAATRYARALLDVSIKEHVDVSRVESDLAGFAGLLEAHGPLQHVLVNPAVPAPRKRGLVEALLARTGSLPIVGKLLLMLAERDRLVLLPDLLAAYRQRMLDHQNIVRAEVTTALPLSAERAGAIEQSLARATGRTVTLTTRVEPAIIGGIVARVGSTVFDGSVTNHLQRLKQRLEESV